MGIEDSYLNCKSEEDHFRKGRKTERSNEELQVSPSSYRDLDELNVPALDDLGRAVRTGQLLGLEDDENSLSPR